MNILLAILADALLVGGGVVVANQHVGLSFVLCFAGGIITGWLANRADKAERMKPCA